MAKTHRKHSYRKSKRWNPSKRRSGRGRRRNCGRNPSGPRDHQNDIETKRYPAPHRRNPVTYSKHLSDGSTVEVARDSGRVTVSDRNGTFASYTIGYGRLAHFINDVKRAGKNSDKYDFHPDNIDSEVGGYELSVNPKRGRKSRSHARRGHRGSRRKSRSHKTHLVGGYGKRRVYEGRSQKRGHKRRRNPAQFPMPFVSAMNPRRRGRKGRNPKIRKSEAKAMRRVLRRHGR